MTEAQQAQRPVDRGVTLLAGDDARHGSTREAVALDVPPRLRQHVVTSCHETDGVGFLAAGDEADGRRRRQPEQLLEPRPRTLLGRRGRGADHRVERALVPARGEHVGRGRRVERTADHESEEARSRGRDEAGFRGRDELVDDIGRGHGVGLQRATERLPQRDVVDDRRRRPFRQRRAVLRADRRRLAQELTEIVHATTVRRSTPAETRDCRWFVGNSPTNHRQNRDPRASQRPDALPCTTEVGTGSAR